VTEPEPERVVRARERAREFGFTMSSEPDVGRLLATLAAAVPAGGRVIELGTGSGSGLAWLVHGLGARDDVSVVSVDRDGRLLAAVGEDDWPGWVELVEGDGADVAAARGPFDLVFADAPSGKTEQLDVTVAALAPGGVLVVDDMDSATHANDGLGRAISDVRTALLDDPSLCAVELGWSSGVILATKRTL
jgi:demethylmenaquinone methyltransferase/2-methoxy-6-polyprenyl-1,4-benzoquinol methylase